MKGTDPLQMYSFEKLRGNDQKERGGVKVPTGETSPLNRARILLNSSRGLSLSSRILPLSPRCLQISKEVYCRCHEACRARFMLSIISIYAALDLDYVNEYRMQNKGSSSSTNSKGLELAGG
jgi:hypothetical protein